MARGPSRIRDRSTFELLRRAGIRARRGPVTVIYAADQGERARVAFGIGRRVGNAVVRNRIRRVLRNEFATLHPAAGAYLVTVSAAAASTPTSELRQALRGAVRGVEGGAR